MHLKIAKKGGFPKMTSLLFIVDHCQTLLGKFGFKQETNVCTTPYNSFVSCKPIYKITKMESIMQLLIYK